MNTSGGRGHRAGWAAKTAAWRRRVGQWAGSGLSQERFCRRHGLALATFQVWRRRLRDAASAGNAVLGAGPDREAFTPVSVKPLAVAGGNRSTWACELCGPRGVKIRLRARPSLTRLRELVSLLAEVTS